LYRMIFEADTPLGKAFDITLPVAIVLSIVAVMLKSVGSIRACPVCTAQGHDADAVHCKKCGALLG